MKTRYSSEFGHWGNPKITVTLIIVWAIVLALFRMFPEVDLAVASYFYDTEFCVDRSDRCIGFPVGEHPVLAPLRELLHQAPTYIGIALLIYTIWLAFRGRRWTDIELRRPALVVAALLLGPLLVVNGVLKELFGRVRPRNITDFGGGQNFTLPGDLAGQCVSNCSFVSGEASAGGWFLCLGVLAATKFRKLAYWLLFAIGFSMALLRVAFGAHFLSDALLGYLISIIIFSILVVISEHESKKKAPQT